MQNYFGVIVFFNLLTLPTCSSIGRLFVTNGISPVLRYKSKYTKDIRSSRLDKVSSLKAFLLLKAKFPWNSLNSYFICSSFPLRSLNLYGVASPKSINFNLWSWCLSLYNPMQILSGLRSLYIYPIEWNYSNNVTNYIPI